MAKIRISVEKLFETGAHCGHQVSRSHPKSKDFIYAKEGGVLIFDLPKTKKLLSEALLFLASAAKKNNGILFLGTKRQIRDKVKEAAQGCGSFFVGNRWLGGTLTNFSQIKKSLEKLEDLKSRRQKGDFGDYTKKELLLVDREIKRLEEDFGGLSGIKDLPSVLVMVDTKKESTALDEAIKTGVPVVAIVDSNSDPNRVDYPIPMNDDSVDAVGYVLDLISQTIKLAREGKKVEIE